MYPLETLRTAVSALATNRLRAMLTTLGIVIGVAAVVALMSLGGSLQDYIESQFLSLGANVLQISATRGRNTASGTHPLTTDAAEGIMAAAPHVSAVDYTYSLTTNVVKGANSDSIQVQGVTANYDVINNWYPMEGGRFIDQNDVDTAARVALIDQQTATDLFGTTNPVGQTVLIKNQVFTIIGEMQPKSTGFSNQSAIIPVSTAQTRLTDVAVAGEGYRVSSIQAQASSTDSATITLATNEVTAYLLKLHGITNPNAADFSVFSAASILDSLESTLGLLSIFLSAIAGISLLVGGIGVMNIMLVSVTERTREIGLRKAVGAQSSTILTQFLMESVLLSLLGGAIGIAVGGLVLIIAGRLAPQLPIQLTPTSAILATGISSAIGILSGMYPARRAALMTPIKALRFE